MLNSPSYFAGGDITPSRFVGISADFRVTQTVLNGKIMGISHEGTRRIPSPTASVDDVLAAKVGESVTVYGQGHTGIFLELGATVTAGAWLKSDALGRGIVCTNTGATPLSAENAGAVAMQGGIVGYKIRIQVLLQPARV